MTTDAMRAVLGCCLAAMALGAVANATFSRPGHVDYTATPISAKQECRALIARSGYDFTVISARVVPATDTVPAHCRVSGLVQVEVRFEVNLPQRWNGRLYMHGNGGLAGTPANDPSRQRIRDLALRHGFATAYTDTGHDRRVEPGGTFAHDNFHKLVDYGFRAVHLTVTSAKRLADAHYGRAPKRSYWHGCSTGGRQAMIAAQRFPEDFDGIIAGAPAADYSGLKFSQAWRVRAMQSTDLTHDEILDIAGHITDRCDAIDGLEDGLIDDPRECDFDPEQHLPRCMGEGAQDAVDCYTEDEVAALAAIYAPVMIGDEEVYPAYPVGSEVAGPGYDGVVRSGWVPWLINEQGPVLLDLLGSDFFRYMVFVRDDPAYNWTDYTFDVKPDGLAEFRDIVDAVDPNLKPFRDAGGKLLSVFGWADPDINPLTAIDYHAAVERTVGDVDAFYRLFLVPGMFHCAGGPGPDRFDAMSALIDWVEAKRAPKRIPAWHERGGETTYERPLCPHPQRARYQGGDQTKASSFRCQ